MNDSYTKCWNNFTRWPRTLFSRKAVSLGRVFHLSAGQNRLRGDSQPVGFVACGCWHTQKKCFRFWSGLCKSEDACAWYKDRSCEKASGVQCSGSRGRWMDHRGISFRSWPGLRRSQDGLALIPTQSCWQVASNQVSGILSCPSTPASKTVDCQTNLCRHCAEAANASGAECCQW